MNNVENSNMGLDILFLGRLFPKENEKEIRSKARVDMQDAANNLQWNIIQGIDNNNINGSLKVLNYLPIDSYPKHYKDCFIKTFIFNHSDNSEDVNVGFCNLQYAKQILCGVNFIKHIKKWAIKYTGKPKVILCYSANTMFLQLISKAKRINKKIHVSIIIADIPEFAANADLRGIKKLFNRYQVKKSTKMLLYADSFVLLTKHMKERLKITKPYIVVEGIAPERVDTITTNEEQVIKNILYSGSLNVKYGIIELLKAFMLIPGFDYRLTLCGLGNTETEINNFLLKDKRIVYLGKVDYQTVLEMQTKATVLVNPRQNNEVFTKYSFPSKNLEYLSSGTPLIAYKLDGIPDEYDNFINYVDNNTEEALADKIIEICELSKEKRAEIGKKAREFVTEYKNKQTQSNKIINLVSAMIKPN